MSGIFDKDRFNNKLYSYYKEHYGERDTDIWYDQPAVNVWVFGRDGKVIGLKADIRTLEVEEMVEEMQDNNK